MKIDCHSHSNYSQDCRETPEQLLAAAEQKQIDILAITDHADFVPGDSIFDPAVYLKHLRRLATGNARVKLLVGVELGIQAEHADRCRNFIAGHQFDFVIASLHRARELDFYYGEFYREHTSVHECWQIYLEEALKAVKAFSDFDIVGHIDIIRRYSLTKLTLIPDDLLPLLDELLIWLIDNRKGIEINTSGKRYGLDSFHPYPAILRRYRQLGGEIVTIGSDSHGSASLGEGFAEAVDLLKECGFDRLAWFSGRCLQFTSLID